MTATSAVSASTLPTAKPVTEEEQNDYLNGVDCFVLIDRSGSMGNEDSSGGTPWAETRESIKHIVDATLDYDDDGIEVAFFNNSVKWVDKAVETGAQVEKIFQSKEYKPTGGTALSQGLEEVFARHFSQRDLRPDQRSLVVVITDGTPNSKDRVISTLRQTADRLDPKRFFEPEQAEPVKASHSRMGKLRRVFKRKGSDKNTVLSTHELGVLFFQVGKDPKAAEFLNKLDDDLGEVKVDFIDHKDMEELSSPDSVRQCFIDAFYD